MADPPSRRYSVSPPRRSKYRSRSRSPPVRGHSPSRLRSGSRSPNDLPDATNPGNNLFVTGLSTRTTEGDLEDYFAKEGKVAECRLVVDTRSKASRGFAFITMDTVANAERCIKYLNGSTLDGRVVTVEKLLGWCQGRPCQSQSYNTRSLGQIIAVPALHQLNKYHACHTTFQSSNNDHNFKQGIWFGYILLKDLHRFVQRNFAPARRRRPRTPTPGRYLGIRRPGYGDRGRRYYEPSRDSYRSQRRDYSPEYSPYRSHRHGRDRDRSPGYSPYRSPRRGYSRSRSLSRSPTSR